MDIRIYLRRELRQAVIVRLQQACRSGQVHLVRRIHALVAIIEGQAVDEVATMLDLGAQTERLTKFQLPSYSPDFNPIEYLWKKVKKQATHLKYFATFEALTTAVDQALHKFATLPSEILALMGRYCETLGAEA